MAAHLHTQLRAAVKAALSSLPTTGARVYTNRLRALGEVSLPGLRIVIGGEDSEDLTVDAPACQQRLPEIVVECCAKEAVDVDAVLDQQSLEVEVALAAGISVGGRLLPVHYAGMQLDEELSDKPVGIKRLRFQIPFTAMSNAPDVLI